MDGFGPSVTGYCIVDEIFGDGLRNNHSVYDRHYVVLARRNNAVLLTADKTLAALCGKMKIEICFQPGSAAVYGHSPVLSLQARAKDPGDVF